jgi:hypothetical protein
MATPKLQGLAKAMAMLEHNMEDGAGKLLAKIESVGSRGEAALTKGNTKIDGIGSRVAEVESFVTALEGANGGDPLDDSSAPSVATPSVVTDAATVPPADRTVTAT